ncbi:HNH endonuclease signature motif containing protein [Ilumatobacter coccineus]|uniref:HNH nuclease domain-containing protein n=1 Tax=Ilumatobacter coccineus (strain NBRC 103263 / KCTC 29153 / YM16-304) TaxID=1313172 RepID=A0A6C7EH40_ILUCY|nr:HNH endonuclease signature motif containing protein [Ilumatobacter coccineus]BAN04295.1 hypothetical protein YM304_39810 [Ilumatobacter coccineus YM16-304]
MIPESTRAAWSALGAADPDSMSRDETLELLDATKRVRAWLDSIELRAARQLRRLTEQGRSEAPESALVNSAGHSGRDARDVTTRDELCDDQPHLEDALATGDLTAKHLDAISAAGRGLPDEVRAEYLAHSDDLLERAQQVSLEQFGRECRELAKHLLAQSRRGLSDAEELKAQRAASKVTRWVDKATGMHNTRVELDPIRDAKLNAAMNRALARIRTAVQSAEVPWQQMQVDAFVAAVTGDVVGARSDSADRGPVERVAVDRVPEITVVVDHDTLVRGAASIGAICETENGVPLPVSTVRRLCCDAEVLPVVLDGGGRVLDEGRSKRTATREQRRALRVLHRSCAHPDCTVGFDACRIHHVVHWATQHGPTDLSNLVPLCERHHHLVHEGGWGLAMTPERSATWTRPDGTVHHIGPAADRPRPAPELVTV